MRWMTCHDLVACSLAPHWLLVSDTFGAVAQRANKMDCLGFFEMSCAGICHSEERLVGLYQDCVLNLGSPGAAGTLLQSAATMNDRARPRRAKASDNCDSYFLLMAELTIVSPSMHAAALLLMGMCTPVLASSHKGANCADNIATCVAQAWASCWAERHPRDDTS